MVTGTPLGPATPPDHAELTAALGKARPLWDRLESWMLDTYGLVGEPTFTGRESGWGLRFRRGGKTLLTLSPRPDRFGALVVIGPSAWPEVAAAPLGPIVRAAWDGARPYPDGRWLFLDVSDDAGEQVVDDIERLITLKSPPPRRVRRR